MLQIMVALSFLSRQMLTLFQVFFMYLVSLSYMEASSEYKLFPDSVPFFLGLLHLRKLHLYY